MEMLRQVSNVNVVVATVVQEEAARRAIRRLRRLLQRWRRFLSGELPEFDEADWVSKDWSPSGLFNEARHVISLVRHAEAFAEAKKIIRELTSLLERAEREWTALEQQRAELALHT